MPQININDVISNIDLVVTLNYDFDDDDYTVDTLGNQISVDADEFDAESYLDDYITIILSQYTLNNITVDSVNQLRTLRGIITNNNGNLFQDILDSLDELIQQARNELLNQVHQAQQLDNDIDTDDTGDTIDESNELEVSITGNNDDTGDTIDESNELEVSITGNNDQVHDV